MSVVRAMTSDDLRGALSVTNAAFGGLRTQGAGAGPAGPAIPALLPAVRFTADPGGCFVAVREQDPDQVTGALFSVARARSAGSGRWPWRPMRSGPGPAGSW